MGIPTKLDHIPVIKGGGTVDNPGYSWDLFQKEEEKEEGFLKAEWVWMPKPWVKKKAY